MDKKSYRLHKEVADQIVKQWVIDIDNEILEKCRKLGNKPKI